MHNINNFIFKRTVFIYVKVKLPLFAGKGMR